MIMNSHNHKMSCYTYTKVFQKGKLETQFSCFSGITQRHYFLLTNAWQNWASLICKCWSLVCEDVSKRVKMKLSFKHYGGRINIQSLILWSNWPLLYTYICNAWFCGYIGREKEQQEFCTWPWRVTNGQREEHGRGEHFRQRNQLLLIHGE